MDWETRERIRDLERQVHEHASYLNRLPIRPGLGGVGGGGSPAKPQWGRVVKGIQQPQLIEDPDNPPAQIPNPDFFRNKIPRWMLRAKDPPALSFPFPATAPEFPDFDELIDFPIIGEPFLFGEVQVVLFEQIPLPTKQELGMTDQDNFPAWWPPPWPVRYWESMQIDTSDPDPANHAPFPRKIPDPDDPLEMIPNESKFELQWWTNSAEGKLLTNSWVKAINGDIFFVSPTTIKREPAPLGGPASSP